MADQKISQLSSGTNAQAGDLFVIARGASNFNLTTAQLFNAPSAAATFASLTVSNDLTVDTSTLKVDSANNRVGIKQATPLHPVHVGATDLILDASGNLGLGVTPSAWDASFRALQIGSVTPFAMDNSGAIGLNFFYDGAYKYVGSSTATLYSLASGQHRWYTAASGSIGANIGDFGTAKMTLTAAGNFGVNCNATNARLEVAATSGEVFRADAASAAARIVADQTKVVVAGNVALGQFTTDFGGGSRVVVIAEADTVPSTNPTGRGILYVEGGALKYRGTSGTVTTIANA